MAGFSGVPLTAIDVSPLAAGFDVYRLLTSRLGTRTRMLNAFAAAGLTVIDTFPFHGYSVACTSWTSVPATLSIVTVLPANRLTYTPSVPLEYIQVGSIS